VSAATGFGAVSLKGKQKTHPAALKKSGRLTAGILTSAAASVGTDPKDFIVSNTPKNTLTKTTLMTKPLSPAAQNVINVTAEQVLADRRINMEHIAAAALRAAADQVEQKLRGFSREACQEIRAIAAELEAS
jgi:hypothetical protein